jgi:hypothetical protein
MRPWSTTRMTSAATIVKRRWAMAIVVCPCAAESSACCATRSEMLSSALVASSRTSTSGSFSSTRAIAMRCFSPPDRRYPRSPTSVSYPLGKLTVVSWMFAARSLFELRLRGVRGCVAQVLGDRGVEEIGLLAYDADVVDQGLMPQCAHIHAREERGAGARLAEARHEVRHRRLACAASQPKTSQCSAALCSAVLGRSSARRWIE